MEQFKVIENYETYKISNFGYIIDLRTGKKIKTHFNTNGYEMINLRNPEGQKLFILHRLVALHFIEKIDNKNEVDHIDRNKKNNHFSNLRWADDFIQSQNRDKMINTKLNEKFI